MACVGLTGSGAAAACRFPGITYCDGCEAVRPIAAKKGDVCVFTSYSGAGSLLGFEITAAPRLGRFGTANRYKVAYVAPRSAGQDTFTYRVRWENKGRKQSMTIKNDVTVRD